MPGTEYSRSDFEIAVVPHDDEGATITWTTPDQSVTGRQRVGSDVVARWVAGLNPLVDLPSLQAALSAWGTEDAMVFAPGHLHRVALDIGDLKLARIPWEPFIGLRIPNAHVAIVRIARTHPRALALPLTLPVRMVEMSPPPGSALRGSILSIFGGHPAERVDQALRIASATPASFPPAGWPTVDILHCNYLESFSDPSMSMSLSEPDRFGTLSWFLRSAEQYQTRLIVLHCWGADDASLARALGAAIVRRGGPAVLVGDFPPARPSTIEYEQFYRNLVHDFPLDFALFGSGGMTPTVALQAPTLFAGAGREDALRVSSIGAALVEIRRQLPKRTVDGAAPASSPVNWMTIDVNPTKSLLIASELRDFESQWQTLRFDLHEREGLLPVARTRESIRGDAGVRGPVAWTQLQRLQLPAIPRPSRSGPIKVPKPYERVFRSTGTRSAVRPGTTGGTTKPTPTPKPARPAQPESRFLNASLWRAEEGARLVRFASKDTIQRGEIYHVGAQIGPQDTLMVTIAATAIIEEIFKFSPDSAGVWVEIGVTGLDFEVLGDPVQELWLPREGPSDIAYFPVRTNKSNWARLRLCLFYKNFVVQSLRLGAVVTEASERDPSPRSRGERLAAALGSSGLGAGTDAGHAARLEYSMAVPVSALENRPERALTLVANDNDGQAVVTVKGNGVPFGVRANNDLPRYVSAVRDALRTVSFPPLAGVAPERSPYGFSSVEPRNVGSSQDLKTALTTLAAPGWQLLQAALPKASREGLESALSGVTRIIHVAHVLLEKTIPWAALYDRPFDPGKRVDDHGSPVLHDACLAALKPDGTFNTTECGTHADCLLHAATIASAKTANRPVPHPDTIACPLHFWGFRHIIELPTQQVRETEKDSQPQATNIRAGTSAQLVAGLNLTLPLAKAHTTELDGILTVKGVSAVWKAKATARDEILLRLNDCDLHAIYLYCHARGGTADPSAFPPYLEFEGTGEAGRITSDLLDPKSKKDAWKFAPLVVLNGCGTAGFSPDALSPFVITLVHDRGASGVVGSEIPIAEPLATEAALTFFSAFLAGTPAGEAILAMRRVLLAKNNPLGLVYVLYSAADLKLTYST